VPVIALPSTRPVYSRSPAVKVISLPRSRPLIGMLLPLVVNVPSIIWNVCVSDSSPSGIRQVPWTFAGTMKSSDVHQLSQLSCSVWVSSGVQS
jgi:hypothetical protein